MRDACGTRPTRRLCVVRADADLFGMPGDRDDRARASSRRWPRRAFAACAIEMQLSPAWTTDWIAPEARRKLRDFGIAPPSGAARESVVDGRRYAVRRAPRRRSCLSPLRFEAHGAARAIRLDGMQGAIPLPRLPRAVRLLQAALMSKCHRLSKFHPLRSRVERETRDAVAITFAVPRRAARRVPLRAGPASHAARRHRRPGRAALVLDLLGGAGGRRCASP